MTALFATSYKRIFETLVWAALKRHRKAAPFLVGTAILLPGCLSNIAAAQTVVLSKIINNQQTSASDVVHKNNSGGGYSFCLDVDGLPSTATPPTFSGPVNVNGVGGVGSFYNGGKLVWSNDRCNPFQAGWGAGNYGNDWGSSTLSDLNSKWGDGPYTVVVNGISYSLSMAGATFVTPMVTLDGGGWSNGKYVINPANALTITTIPFAGYGAHPYDEISAGIFDSVSFSKIGGVSQNYLAAPTSNFVSFRLPPSTLAGGNDYVIGASNRSVADVKGDINSSSNARAYYETVTFVTVSVDNSAPIPAALLTVTKTSTGANGLGNVSSSPAGIDCGHTCSANFTGTVTLTATSTPASGITFAGWGGACTGTGTCTVTMNAAKNVTATFQPVPFNVVTAGVTDGVITAPIATVTTTIQFNPPDVGKTGSVFITALVPANALGAFGITQSGTKSLRTVAINAVTDSSAPVLIQLTPSGWQPVTNGQLIPFATGVLGDQLAAQTILTSTDTSNLKGTQICLGYGASVADMTTNGKMQLVATIPDPNAKNPITGSCLITPWSVSASNQGAGAQDVTLQIVFTPDLSDRSSPLNLYVAGLYAGQYYFVTLANSNMNIVPYSGGALPVYSAGSGANLTTQGWTIPLGNISTLKGLQIYTGLGRSDSDMLNKGQVKLIYSVN